MAIITTALFGDLVFLPYRVEAPMKETLSWKTSVFTSHDGTESTEKKRTIPRTKLQYSLPIPADEMARSFNLFSNTIGQTWAVPLWSEEQYIGAVSSGATSVSATVANYAFRNASLALLWESKTKWQLLEITTVDGASINISGTTDEFTNALLMPCRVGYIDGMPKRNSNVHNGNITVDFQVSDGKAVAEIAPAQHLTNDIYTDEVLGGENITETLENKVNFVDGNIGAVSYSTPWTDSRNKKQVSWVLETPAEIYSFRQFMARRAGKYRVFWQPSFFNDLRNASTGTVLATLKVYADDYLEHATDRIYISVQDMSGAWHHRNISVALVDTATVTSLVLDSALNLESDDIKTISYTGLRRLEADNITLNWLGGGVVKSTVSILEVSH